MALPNFYPSWIIPATPNCTIFVKEYASDGTLNAQGNLNLTNTTHEVTGYAVAEANPTIVNLIGAAPEEMALRIWLNEFGEIPAYLQSQKVYTCTVELGGITRSGLFTVIPIGHPFVPKEKGLGFVVGRFKSDK